MRLSSRALAVAESETLRLAGETARLRRSGVAVVSLLEGEPDLPPPRVVVAATVAALKAGHIRYSSSAGLPRLRAAVAKKLRTDNNIPAQEADVLITNGAKQAIYEALQTLLDPGDEAIVLKPYWVTLPEAVCLAGAKPVFVETPGWALDPDLVAKSVTRRTKVVIINSPNNPTGAVYSKESLQDLIKLAAKRDLSILSDEAYESLVYDGARHVSPASLGKGAAKRVVTVQTFSKTWSMTGFRLGYMAAHEDFIRAAAKVHGHITGNAATFAQYGALEALALPAKDREERRAALERRRDLACALAAPLFDCVAPQGALYLFADARRTLGERFKGSAALAADLLKRARVAVAPGVAFGQEGFLRISFAQSEADIRDGFARMAAAL